MQKRGKKNNKNEMSKTFFIFFSIPKDLFFGESNIYQNMWCFTRKWGLLGVSLTCEELSGSYLEGNDGVGFSKMSD